ncbi:S100P-binding protein [Nelusetta ayraudi]|uniref:S100P-binding protein n=1 Tax=Nelusetta ayraudi TaxID=303726 RepID=UPI003F6F508B
MMFKHKRQKHLTPLSKYARKLCDDLVTHTSICRFLKPSNNFKNDTTKTRAVDCGQNAASSKKPSRPQTLSPDVGCFVDSPSPRKDAVACEARQYEGSLLDDIGSPPSSKCEETRSIAPSFDLDVDDMLNLSPCGDGCKRVPDCDKRCQPDVSSPSPALPLEQSQRKGGRRSPTAANATGSCLIARTTEEDGGYCSYRAEDQTESKDLSVSAHRQPRQASSSQLHLDVVKEKNLPESFQVQGPSSRQHLSFLVSDLETMSGGPRSELARSPRKVLESPVEELWTVGLPMLQSSLCHSPSVNLFGEESETSCGTESPLQVKVKSVVVTIGQQTCRSERTVSQPSSKRRVVFHRDSLDAYLSSVTQHIKAPEANGGVMVELSNLMSRVADQPSGSSTSQWQHPSDLTCRNFRSRFRNLTPSLSLCEWRAKNSKAGKRFAELPAFKRSRC